MDEFRRTRAELTESPLDGFLRMRTLQRPIRKASTASRARCATYHPQCKPRSCQRPHNPSISVGFNRICAFRSRIASIGHRVAIPKHYGLLISPPDTDPWSRRLASRTAASPSEKLFRKRRLERNPHRSLPVDIAPFVRPFDTGWRPSAKNCSGSDQKVDIPESNAA